MFAQADRLNIVSKGNIFAHADRVFWPGAAKHIMTVVLQRQKRNMIGPQKQGCLGMTIVLKKHNHSGIVQTNLQHIIDF